MTQNTASDSEAISHGGYSEEVDHHMNKEMNMIILVLNLGLKSVRCIAFFFAGKVLGQSSQSVHTLKGNEIV